MQFIIIDLLDDSFVGRFHIYVRIVTLSLSQDGFLTRRNPRRATGANAPQKLFHVPDKKVGACMSHTKEP